MYLLEVHRHGCGKVPIESKKGIFVLSNNHFPCLEMEDGKQEMCLKTTRLRCGYSNLN